MTIDPRIEKSFGVHQSLGWLVAKQSAASPRHVPFLSRRFLASSEDELRLCDSIAQQIIQLADHEIDAFFAGYDFICDIQKREEIYFRRHDSYRLKSVSAAVEEVYGNREYMQNYMRGLLMTQVFWSNHSASIDFFLKDFLAENKQDYDLLEVGPGHGLLFSRAATDPRARSIAGWDLSAASVAETREALRRLGVNRPYTLEVRDLLESHRDDSRFDAVVFSEVLEHLEEPERALDSIMSILRPGGRVYINVPINSPAPDHLFLMRSPEEAVSFVEKRGFEIERTGFFPATNYTLASARKHSITISTCIVATKPRA
jgi:2-polyprenyl-3-methyl-5-hydroxy-6-metoxy-1,4-benzoquinol methylase